tara:strand:- start:401 stop:1420 length:1020 start_codon:yes stop_codon:yes gene_type:complete
MSNFAIIFIIFLILNYFLFKQNDYISNKIELYDYPDNKRKLHKKKTALTGGIFIFLNLIIFFFLLKIDYLQIPDLDLQTEREIVSFSLLIISQFTIGFYDDKYELNPFKKLFLSAFFIFVCLVIDENLIIRELNFFTESYSIKLSVFSIPFTILSFLLFLNALNMFDGIDLQVPMYTSFLFIYFILNENIQLIIFILPVMLFIIYYNFKKKLFLGDSGSNLLAALISYIIIKNYNSGTEVMYCDEILLLMLVPGLDMLRLFIFRIYKGKNPFLSDNQHIHHLYFKNFSKKFTIFIIQMHIVIPLIIFSFFNYLLFILIISSIIIYFLCIIFFKISRRTQ